MVGQKSVHGESNEHPTLEELLQKNKDYVASTHQPLPYLTEIPNMKLPSVVVVACCDMRSDPANFLQLEPGEVLAIRCVGGRIESVLDDVVTFDAVFRFREVVIIHHTDCGVTYLPAGTARDYLRSVLPDVSEAEIQNHPIRVFSDDTIEQSVRDDLETVRNSPMVRKGLKEAVSGFVFDIKSGLLKPIQ